MSTSAKTIQITKKYLGVYLIQDIIKGQYSLPIFKFNDLEMERHFKNLMTKAAAQGGVEPTDFKLFKIGEYNEDHGDLVVYPEMEFMINGGVE